MANFFTAQTNKQSRLKKRVLLSGFTFLVALPGLGSIVFLFGPIESLLFSPVAMMTSIGGEFLLRGVLGVIAAVGLWRGTRWGYKAAIVMWGILVVASLFNLYQAIFPNETIDLLFLLSEDPYAQLRFAVKAIGKLVWGIPIIFILRRDLSKVRKTEEQKRIL